MTLFDVVKAIEAVAAAQPAVKTIVKHDIFRLNAMPDAKYGVFAWLVRSATGNPYDGRRDYSLTLFYADRLADTTAEDYDNDYLLRVQSFALEVLDNIVKGLEQHGIIADDYTFTPFRERFADVCGGGFVTITLHASDTGCADTTNNE